MLLLLPLVTLCQVCGNGPNHVKFILYHPNYSVILVVMLEVVVLKDLFSVLKNTLIHFLPEH